MEPLIRSLEGKVNMKSMWINPLPNLYTVNIVEMNYDQNLSNVVAVIGSILSPTLES